MSAQDDCLDEWGAVRQEFDQKLESTCRYRNRDSLKSLGLRNG